MPAQTSAQRSPSANGQPRFLDIEPSRLRRLTARWRVLPDFLIVGVQACGTTSLYSYLGRHPLVVRCHRHQMHFFDFHYDKGLDWYRAFFPTRAQMRTVQAMRRARPITGEATGYSFYPFALPRLLEALPDVRALVLLRDPVRRAFSHYHKSVRKGWESLSFEDAIDAELADASGGWLDVFGDPKRAAPLARRTYLMRGCYDDQLHVLLDELPPEQLMVIQSEAMFADPAAVFDHLVKFLDLPAWSLSNPAAHNQGRYDEQMSDDMRKRLYEWFAPHNRRLADLLGVEFDWPVRNAPAPPRIGVTSAPAGPVIVHLTASDATDR